MSPPRQFCLVSETFPPEVNGVALTVAGLAAGLGELGHAVQLIRPRQPGGLASTGDSELLVAGAGVPRYPGLRFGLPAGRQIADLWQRQRPDAVYIATEGPLGWSALRAARRLRIPVASGFHTRFDQYAERYGLGLLRPWVFAWMRRFHNRADATLVPTAELREFLCSEGFQRVRVLSRAVDTHLFHPSRRSDSVRAALGLDGRSLLMIHVGRIAAEKNLELLLRAFRAVQTQLPEARLLMVGDGPARAGLAAAHPDLLFTGVLRGEALASHFASADLFVFPSLSETFGNVTLEAMASAVPAVAYHYGAAREHLRDGEHGAAIRCGDESGFIDATVRLATSAQERVRCGKAAREAVAHLSPGSVARAFADTLIQLAERSAA